MEPTVNKLLLDFAVRHGILIERYKMGSVQAIIKLLNTVLEPKLLAQLQHDLPLNVLKQRVGDLIRAEYGNMKQNLDNRLIGLSKVEATWLLKSLKSATPIGWNFIAPAPELLHKLATTTPSQGALVSEWFSELSSRTVFRINQTISSGIIQGEGIPEIVRSIKGTAAANYSDGILNASRHDLNSIVRSSVGDIVSAVREETFSQNSDIIDGVQIVATLDTATCEECMKMDGDVYPIGEGPRPLFHFQCRCTPVPVLKSWKELGINAQEISETTRASMNGQVASTMNYKDWLAEQSVEVQNEALGIGKAEEFRAGTLKGFEFNTNVVKPIDVGGLSKL